MKVAVVHEWLESYAGSERVLEQIIECFPQADVFAVCNFLPPEQQHFLRGKKVYTTFIQRLPFARKRFRWYLGVMPLAIEQLDMSGYDLVLSSNHAVAKGVVTGPGQMHVCYMHSPMRYAWDLQHQYLRQSGLDRGFKGLYTRLLLSRMRAWDRGTADGVDLFLANSSYIAQRVMKVYRRDALIIHPPVDIERFSFVNEKSDDYLVASRFVPYKRVDLIIDAFRRTPQRRLIVVGHGPEAQKVRASANGAKNVEFRGVVAQAELIGLMQRARAVLFAAEEDFGIAMVEAQACGTPVIGFRAGGARDIVRALPLPQATGVLFEQQTPEAVIEAVGMFEKHSHQITPEACRENARRFSIEQFRTKLADVIEQVALSQMKVAPKRLPFHVPASGLDWKGVPTTAERSDCGTQKSDAGYPLSSQTAVSSLAFPAVPTLEPVSFALTLGGVSE